MARHWTSLTLAYLAIAAAASLAVATNGPPASVSDAGVDPGIRPGDDFFAYANGAWLEATALPTGYDRWGARNEIEEQTRHQLADLIQEARARPSSSYARKVADFYSACLDRSAIESRGLDGIRPLLDRIDRVQDRVALSQLLGSELRADVDPLNFGVYSSTNLFGLAVQRGIHGEKRYFAYLLQGGLGLPSADYYLSAAPLMESARNRYAKEISRILKLSGFNQTEQRARQVLALETAIARTRGAAQQDTDEGNADNHWGRTDFASQAPGIDWGMFFQAAGLSRSNDLVVWQPGAIRGESTLVASYPLEVWKDYLRYHLIHRYADVLPAAFSNTALGTAAHSEASNASGELRALNALNRAMPEALGRMYVEKYFPAESKRRIQAMVSNILEVFEKRIAAEQWMTPATRTRAILKLQGMYFGVGYPEHWTEYGDLDVKPHDALGNARRVEQWSYDQALRKLDRPADPTEWAILPQTVAAVFLPLQNAYNFSAALLQAPKYDASASDAANYGSIGAIVGHEISHFVDTLGADYDVDGSKRHWWTPADKKQFDASCAALITQFSRYHPYADLSVNGQMTLSENVADLGGLAVAFDAYRRTLGVKSSDRNEVRQQDRQFFIGFARAWRVKTTEDALRAQVTSSDHAPETFRVSTVRNIDAWYDAFDVRPGQRLYLEPEARVRIW